MSPTFLAYTRVVGVEEQPSRFTHAALVRGIDGPFVDCGALPGSYRRLRKGERWRGSETSGCPRNSYVVLRFFVLSLSLQRATAAAP